MSTKAGADSMDIVLNFVFPALGVIIGTSLFAAPLPALKTCLRRGTLGDLNPLPWSFMTGNTLGWTAYSFITKDVFVFLGNGPPLILSVYMNMGAVQLQYAQRIRQSSRADAIDGNVEMESPPLSSGESSELQEPLVRPENMSDLNTQGHNPTPLHEVEAGTLLVNATSSLPTMVPQIYPLLLVLSFWVIFFAAAAFSSPSNERLTDMVGLAATFNLIFFFVAPLSTIVTVIRLKSAHSIHKRTMYMTILNCFFWMLYGFAIRDPFIYTPNVIGLLLGLFQAALCVCYPSKTPSVTLPSSQSVKHDE